jgi:MFS transporter, SP family, sugar:H+ symporter
LKIQWLLNFVIAFVTPYLVDYGPNYANLQSKVFFIWFGACFICIAFVYFFIYETKGLSLEEVDEMYSECPSARKSSSWTPSIGFRERQRAATGPAPDSNEKAATVVHSDSSIA